MRALFIVFYREGIRGFIVSFFASLAVFGRHTNIRYVDDMDEGVELLSPRSRHVSSVVLFVN